MVSIIIPVYNAEQYLNECLDSILEQTYSDMEIVCVDDGSTDKSFKILKKYQLNDRRFHVIHQENLGQGYARNQALIHAHGEFIMYVDADDWLESDCVEKLVRESVESQADVVIGRIAKTKYESKRTDIVLKECEEKVIDNRNKKRELFQITTYPFARLIKRKLLIDNNILFQNHYWEDVAVFPVIYALADKIVILDQVVYHYRNNQGSTVNRLDEIVYDRIKCLDTLMSEFKERNLYTIYSKQLTWYIMKRCRVNLRCIKRLCDRFYDKFEKDQNTYLCNLVDTNECDVTRVCSFGSYNLMVISKIFMWYGNLNRMEEYYGGQSIISAMSTNSSALKNVEISHENQFRQKCLIQDFEKTFANLNPIEFCDIDYVFVDLLEERYDVGKCETGEYFTISEYFKDILGENEINYRVIQTFSDEWYLLWKDACRRFVNKVKEYISENRIVLIKMKLARQYYTENELLDFNNQNMIEYVNENLERCYEIFADFVPAARVIEVDAIGNYYTDESFKYGCYPWHLNTKLYSNAARHIEGILKNECNGAELCVVSME